MKGVDMKNSNDNPVPTCGCSAQYLNHKPGEPTIFDIIAQRIVGLFSKKTPKAKMSVVTIKQYEKNEQLKAQHDTAA